MRIFITGICGLLGSNLGYYLAQQGHEVIGCDNLIGGVQSNSNRLKHCELHLIDARHTFRLAELMEGCDVVLHTAALAHEGLSVFAPATIVDSIVSVTMSVASAALRAKVDKMVFFSSMARYGNMHYPPFHEYDTPVPIDPYGLAKVQAEQQLKLLNQLHGLNYTILVPHNIIGIGQRYTDPYRNVAAIMINRCLQGLPLIIYGDGNQKRSFSDVDDCVQTIERIMEADIAPGEVYNIGPDSNEITINILAEVIAEICGAPLKIKSFPDRPAEAKLAFCSSKKVKTQFGYTCNTPLTTTLRKMVNWIEAEKPKPFEYNLKLEFETEETPKTWTQQLI